MESKNYKCGSAIEDINDLYTLAVCHRSVFHYKLGLKPARVIVNMSAWQLIRDIKKGRICKAVKKRR